MVTKTLGTLNGTLDPKLNLIGLPKPFAASDEQKHTINTAKKWEKKGRVFPKILTLVWTKKSILDGLRSTDIFLKQIRVWNLERRTREKMWNGGMEGLRPIYKVRKLLHASLSKWRFFFMWRIWQMTWLSGTQPLHLFGSFVRAEYLSRTNEGICRGQEHLSPNIQ